MALDILGFVYASFLAIGGVVGFLKKRVLPPLIAGLGLGALATYAAIEVC